MELYLSNNINQVDEHNIIAFMPEQYCSELFSSETISSIITKITLEITKLLNNGIIQANNITCSPHFDFTDNVYSLEIYLSLLLDLYKRLQTNKKDFMYCCVVKK